MVRIIATLAALSFAAQWSAPALAATTVSGTYVAAHRQGALSFTGLRAFRGGIEGKFVVDGKTYPGSMYAAVGGGTGFVWYFGTSGIMAGNALVTTQADGTQSGPIWFFDRAGNQVDSGTLSLN